MSKAATNLYQEGLFVNLPAPERLRREVEESGLPFKRWYHEHYLKSDHWRQLRESKFAVSGRKCQQCPNDTQFVDVHHLSYKSLYDVTVFDLLVVCKSCHDNLHAHEHTAPKCAKAPAMAAAVKPKPRIQQMGTGSTTQRQRKAAKKALKRLRREQKAEGRKSEQSRTIQKLVEQAAKIAEKSSAQEFPAQWKPRAHSPETPIGTINELGRHIGNGVYEKLPKEKKGDRFKIVREIVRPNQFDSEGNPIVTKDMVMAIRTQKGAWTARQFACFGLPFLPPKGWLSGWKPISVPMELWKEAESITRSDLNLPSVAELLKTY